MQTRFLQFAQGSSSLQKGLGAAQPGNAQGCLAGALNFRRHCSTNAHTRDASLYHGKTNHSKWKTMRLATDANANANAIAAHISGFLMSRGAPLQLTTLGQQVGWERNHRIAFGRLSSFIKSRPEFWTLNGQVGMAHLRDWARPKCQSTALSEFRILELFAGIGGLRVAFQRACALAGETQLSWKEWVPIDRSPLSNAVYSLNFDISYAPLVPIDVRKLVPEDVDGADAWLLSPPCQPYTRLGLHLDESDKRARPLEHLASMLPKLRKLPRMFFLENVGGFEASKSCQQLASILKSCGFEIRLFRLSPLQLGIPNRRPRIYLLARKTVKESKIRPIENVFPGLPQIYRPGRLDSYLDKMTHREASRWVPPKEHLHKLESRGIKWEVVAPSSTSSSTFTSGYGKPCHKAYQFGPLLSMDGNITNHSNCDDGLVRRTVQYDEAVRYFTPDEILRLSGFPSNFRFPDAISTRQRYKLLGDSINVEVVARLLRFLFFEWVDETVEV